MLDKKQMQEIQDLKLRGYTKLEILDYYKQHGVKLPSCPTIPKYYDMDVVPEDPGAKFSKDKVFDISHFRELSLISLKTTTGTITVFRPFTMSLRRSSSKTVIWSLFRATRRPCDIMSTSYRSQGRSISVRLLLARNR